MNDREKLIDILESAESAVYWNSDDCGFIEKIADHLIANGVTVQKWIPVSERFPPKGVFVLFQYAKNSRKPTMFAKNTMAVGRYENKMFIVDGCAVLVTHWMPIPEPPEEGICNEKV